MKIAMIDSSSSQQEAATATREAVAGTTAGTTTTTTTVNDDANDLSLFTGETAAEEDHETLMNRAMALLPDELTFEYRQACRFVPELVEKESKPRWFLR